MINWTIAELGDEVERALASDYQSPASGRIRAVPDARTIRYYTTLGLIDRPAAMRGRTALYGERHLRQLVAIKRMQAQGRSLAEIQHALAGIPDVELASIARISPRTAPGSAVRSQSSPAQAPGRARAFWRTPDDDASAEDESDQQRDEGDDTSNEKRDLSAAELPVRERAQRPAPIARAMTELDLAPGVTLVLTGETALSHGDALALARAAAPLIEELQARGYGFPHNQRRV